MLGVAECQITVKLRSNLDQGHQSMVVSSKFKFKEACLHFLIPEASYLTSLLELTWNFDIICKYAFLDTSKIVTADLL